MSKFKLTQTAAEVQDILNNSLQKPTGLTKTKLVGVGVNGQENIEIGDNLTLANGKLSGGSGASNITISYVPKSRKAYIEPGTYSSNTPIKSVFDNYPWLDANILPPSIISPTATCKDNTGATITLIVYLYKYNNYKLGLILIPTKEFTVDSTVYTDYSIQWEEVHITIA